MRFAVLAHLLVVQLVFAEASAGEEHSGGTSIEDRFRARSVARGDTVETQIYIEGYVWPISPAQGDTVGIYVSTDAPTFDLRILREGALTVEYSSTHDIPGSLQAVPDSAWQGCGWEPSILVPIPLDWPSGIYVAELSATDAVTHYGIFTVCEDEPGSTAKILYQIAVTTRQAYNTWGGKSLFDETSTNGEPAYIVSFQRPYTSTLGRPGRVDTARWLEGNGFAVEYCTSLEVHTDSSLLSRYDLFLSSGHDEYWSNEMRNNVEGMIASGGNVAFLGGQTCWWQMRFEPGLDRMICYKDAALDPLYGVEDSLVTVRWRDPPVNRPENVMTGVSSANGGIPFGDGSYTVTNDDHWVLNGTGLTNGMKFGAEQYIVGIEVDGALFEWQGGLPVVTGEDGTPPSFVILGLAPSSGGFATMGFFQSAGMVFNAATINWNLGLLSDPIVHTITNTVVTSFVNGDPFVPREGRLVVDAVSWEPAGSDIVVRVDVRNDSVEQISRFAAGELRFQVLGDFLDDKGSVFAIDAPPLPPQGTFEIRKAVPLDSLPPSAPRIQPSGPGCFPDSLWRGSVHVSMTEAGVPGAVNARTGHATLVVTPGSASSYVRIAFDCPDPAGASWMLEPPCPGWSASLLEDDGGGPGGPASNPLPPGSFTGWVAVAADSSVGGGGNCRIEIALSCAGTAAAVEIQTRACFVDPTDVGIFPAPADLVLHPGYPNPAAGALGLRFDLPARASVKLRVYDVRGRLVRVLVDGVRDAGSHRVSWSGRDESGAPVAGGVYLVRLEALGRTQTKKAVLLGPDRR